MNKRDINFSGQDEWVKNSFGCVSNELKPETLQIKRISGAVRGLKSEFLTKLQAHFRRQGDLSTQMKHTQFILDSGGNMEKTLQLRLFTLIAVVGTTLSLAFLWGGWAPGISHAQAVAGAQALAARGKGGVTGIRTFVWTAQQPAVTNNWRSSPVAVCTLTPPCEFTETRKGYYVETGYNKGDNSPRPNVLQQYAAWTSPNPGESGFDWNLGDLADNTWYKFVVIADPTSNLWLIKRGGQQVDSIGIANIGYGAGRMVNCGAEAALPKTKIAVECDQMSYKYQGSWTKYNFNFAQTSDGYCVVFLRDFNAIGQGPC